MQNEKIVRRMKIIRTLMLAPILIIIAFSTVMAILSTYNSSETISNSIPVVFLIIHFTIVIVWAILAYILAEYVEGEGVKWGVAAFFIPYIVPIILFFKTNRTLRYTGTINGISIDTLIDEFQNMFTEFNMAETEKMIASGRRPDSELIARASVERAGSFLISKYHLSPAQASNVVEMYLKKKR